MRPILPVNCAGPVRTVRQRQGPWVCNRRMIYRAVNMTDITLFVMGEAILIPTVEDQRVLLTRVSVRRNLLIGTDAK